MYNIIAASFFQKRVCILPGIGKLLLVTKPAVTDFPNKQIKAPVQEIVFNASPSYDNIFNEFSAISELMRKSLDENGMMNIEGIGIFSKDADNISFSPVAINEYIQVPVVANRVIRQHSQHAMLVGDKETTNTAMTELLGEEETIKDRWWLWAAILGGIGVIVLAIYISQHGINSFGNITP